MANFYFRGPRLFEIGSPPGSFATSDVIQIITTRARYIHWTSWFNSKGYQYYFILNSLDIRKKTVTTKRTKKAVVKLFGHTLISKSLTS